MNFRRASSSVRTSRRNPVLTRTETAKHPVRLGSPALSQQTQKVQPGTSVKNGLPESRKGNKSPVGMICRRMTATKVVAGSTRESSQPRHGLFVVPALRSRSTANVDRQGRAPWGAVNLSLSLT